MSWLGRVALAASLVFLGIASVRNLEDIPPVAWSAGGAIEVAAATVIIAATVVMAASGWVTLLRGGGVRLSLTAAVVVTGRAQVAKYLPGNVFQYVGRVTMARAHGVPLEAGVITVTVEAFLLAAVAAVIGVAGALADPARLAAVRSAVGGHALVPALVAAAAAPVLVGAAWLASSHARDWLRGGLAFLGPRSLAGAVAWYLPAFLVLGTGGWLAYRGLWDAGDPGWLQVTSAFSLSWVAGFITPGAPGGIGVREAVLTALLAPEIGAPQALGFAFALRLVTTVADLLLFALSLLVPRTPLWERQARTAADPKPAAASQEAPPANH